MRIVYADNNATTAVAAEVLAAMQPFFCERYGNPSSVHAFGSQLEQDLARARQAVAELAGARPEEIVFTSGGTEGNNLAIRGVLERPDAGRHVITSPVEHAAVREVLAHYRRRGWNVTEVPVDGQGRLDPAGVRRALRPETALVAVMAANNETGVLYPVGEIAAIAREAGVPFFCDAVQAWGKLDLKKSDGPALASLSAHKLHGPKGVGALVVRRGTRIIAQNLGGGQEEQRRSGTENVPGIVGLGAAARLAQRRLPDWPRVAALRDRLQAGLTAVDSRVIVNGEHAERLPNTLNICIPGIEGEALLLLLGEEGICASSGSACKSGQTEPSHVLLAMGRTPEEALGAVRFSLSHENSDGDIDAILAAVPRHLSRLRALSPGA